MSRDDNPMDRARAALEAAREARGATDDEPEALVVDPRNPLAAAEAALQRAKEAREAASATGAGPGAAAAVAKARRELERLKRSMGSASSAAREVTEGAPVAEPEVGADEDEEPTERTPRRRL